LPEVTYLLRGNRRLGDEVEAGEFLDGREVCELQPHVDAALRVAPEGQRLASAGEHRV
jgi:hypothetical protein